ncbi:heterokaryon incompatibility protein [Xylaria flabelliformis]|nr:heterokaryon incompatibility protein [Xylaria flabelliformis]
MPFSTGFCSTCRRILCSACKAKPSDWIVATGQTFKVFQEAVEQGCAICSTIWNADDQHSKAWPQISPEAWEPARFNLGKGTGEVDIEDFINVSVVYHNPISGGSARLWFRLIPSDDWKYKPYFKHPKIEPSTSSAATLTAAYGWFTNGRLSHLRCHEPAAFKSDWLPTRLIDAGHPGSTDWRLRITSEDGILPQSAPYTTLSYRWAPNPSLVLLTSNIIEFRAGKPIETLPQLFRDMIVVAHRFSIRYIWIDALCIVQDSREDWETQASTMKMVYAHSTCNIAASGANSPDEGLFRARNPEAIQPGLVPFSLFSSSENQPHYIFEKRYWDREILAGPLHNRGWVFQERILPPRVLYFGKNQVLWECLTEHKCEGFPNGIPGHHSDKKMDPLFRSLSSTSLNRPQKMELSIFNLWQNVVQRYSQCALTYPSDKLFAIAGIAQLFHDATGDEYVAGLWKSRLIEMLDWQVFKPESWASLDGPVFPWGLRAHTRPTVELLDVHVQARTSNAMAGVLKASIILRAKTLVAVCHYLKNGRCVLLTEGCQFSDYLLDNLAIELPEGKEVICMPFKKDCYKREEDFSIRSFIVCLILEELPCPSSSQAQYRRLGIFEEDISEHIAILNTRSEIRDIEIV